MPKLLHLVKSLFRIEIYIFFVLSSWIVLSPVLEFLNPMSPSIDNWLCR